MRNVGSSRPICQRCERPLSACICRFVAPTANRTEVLVLQHPSEAGQAKGTARLLALSLARCTVQVGEQFTPPDDGLENWLLYPGPAAPAGSPGGGRSRLIVLDGTWRKSRLLLQQNPWLQALPRLALDASSSSGYSALRRAHAPGQLSTLEATALALGQIESNEARYTPLLAGFAGFVDYSISFSRQTRHAEDAAYADAPHPAEP
ncbi:MAG TPA: tRNA-uridine aminocarboxypropyltransferase [Burkholderiaceae bacterium]